MVIKNLVFEGGGVKGGAYAGALQILDEKGHFGDVQRIAGTSAGSITASLLASGAGSKGLLDSVINTDFHDFIFDRGGFVGNVARVTKHFGLHSGDSLCEMLRQRFEIYCGKRDVTFQELFDASNEKGSRQKELFVIASNLSTQKGQVLSRGSFPDLPVWKAVRASLSIPFIFTPFEIDGDFYVDGGLSWNYPIDIFDADDPHDAVPGASDQPRDSSTLGFYLSSHDALAEGETWGEDRVVIDSLKTFSVAVGSFMFEVANQQHVHPKDLDRTVFIDDLGVSGAKFDTPKAKILDLIESGKSATTTYFESK